MRLLSIDWDYFFPMPDPRTDMNFLYDWGHSEEAHPALYLDSLWVIRAAQFIDQGYPLPSTSGDEVGFWDHFRFNPGAVLFYADSHAQIYKPEVRYRVHEVVSFDAHHDAYETAKQVVKSRTVNCANWVTALTMLGIRISIIYPTWDAWMLDDKPKIGIEPQMYHPYRQRKFDKAFVCRSGAWTPSWIEDKFWKFIEDCPIDTKVELDGMTKRTFNPQEAEELATQIRKARGGEL